MAHARNNDRLIGLMSANGSCVTKLSRFKRLRATVPASFSAPARVLRPVARQVVLRGRLCGWSG
jgi:hypothetical protein